MKYLKRLLLLFLISFLGGGVFGQSSAELKRRKKALTREIQLLNESLKRTSNNKQLSLKQINSLSAEILLREQKILMINSEVRQLNEQIIDNTNTVKALKKDLYRLRKEYAAMVLFAFKNKGDYNKLVFLFSAKEFNQGYKRLKYLNQFSKYRKKQSEYIRETQQGLHVKIVELDHNKKEKSVLLQDEQEEKVTLRNKKEEQAKVLSKLSNQEEKIQKQLADKKNESARLNRAIRSAINREIELARKREAVRVAAAEKARKLAQARAAASNLTSKPTGKSTSGKTSTASRSVNVLSATPESAKLSTGFRDSKGVLPWPVAVGTIVEGFGAHRYGVNVTIENNGIDIKTGAGSAVRAVFAGEVSTVQDIGGSYAVLIRHGEYFTVYSNLKSAGVSRGQKVNIKQSLGTVLTDPDGSTQLHFEIRKGASPLNPASWLSR